MKVFSAKIVALTVAGVLAASSGAQAGGLFDKDDNGYSGSYNRQSLDAYCDRRPYDDACRGYDRPQYGQKHYRKKVHNYRCRALIRAAGKRNLIPLFARNSARFAWKREVRAVHGAQYAKWHNARNPRITCTRHGGLKACVARATPCRY